MNLIRSWREQKVMLKWRYPFLTDEDFIYSGNNKEPMLLLLERKLQLKRAELELLFTELQRY
ncbi:MAG: hypothetical protein RLO81_04520 [Fulvivirga sp.]|uniref:hypothetical protein n=1 Tax=Fulvivirga sp. TaxID=1931237 RepID=UPI0032EBB26D